jgi:DNA-binding response OmpR family regulator
MTQRPREPAGASGTVIVVDRDQSLRLQARRLLESEGYRVLDAGDGAGAEQIATLYVGPIHVLLIDAEMSTSDGRGLSDRLQSLHPELAVLVASGRPQRELVRRGVLGARTPFVRKPFEKARLAARIRDTLARPR